jgi:hypothetical protein
MVGSIEKLQQPWSPKMNPPWGDPGNDAAFKDQDRGRELP